MKKQDLVELILDNYGGSKVKATGMINQIIEMLIMSLRSGREVSLAGFGKFRKLKRKKRGARNPRTGEKVLVPARNVVRFFPSKTLKKKIN